MKKYFIYIFIFVSVVSYSKAFENYDKDIYYKIYNSINLYTNVYKEIIFNYVDTINIDECMRAGIDGMLKTLDPYTVYIPEKDNDEIDIVTTGRYGGVGITIGLKDEQVVIINVAEGYSAHKQGIKIGDKIIAIEGKNAKGMSLDDVRMLVRGAPGTMLKLQIERIGKKEYLDFNLTREIITVKNISYADYLSDGIAYIKLERFTKSVGDDLREALKNIIATGQLKGLVLDLRDNPGGLLEGAVDVVSKFVDENSLVVFTRGKKNESEIKYYSKQAPMIKDVPLVVLVNKNSASASEIVSGAIQDLDRGIIVGEKTFGKGLVQTVSPVSEKTSLKITTARYFTPSGRCIQELDYWHHKKDTSIVKEYLTLNKRIVKEGGGIYPDSIVYQKQNLFVDALERKSIIFNFVNELELKNKLDNDKIVTENNFYDEFKIFIKKSNFEYQEESEIKLRELKQIIQSNHYDDILKTLNQLEIMIKQEIDKNVLKYKNEIIDAINAEIMLRTNGNKAKQELLLKKDYQLQVATELLKNKSAYNKILHIKK